MKRDGAVLIEVLVAIAILGVAAASVLGYTRELAEAQHRVHDREVEITLAEALLLEHVTMSATQLSQRLGVRPFDAFVVWVDRPEATLYRIGVAPATRPAAELLATLVHKPDATEGRRP